MDIELAVRERITLLNLLPEKGDILTLKTLRELKESLGIDEEEKKNLGLVVNGGQITWNSDKEKEAGGKKIKFGESMTEVIKTTLNALNDKKELQEAHVSIWDKFCK